MARASNTGQMEPNTTATGVTIWLKESVCFSMQTVTSIKANFIVIEQMDTELTFIQMARNTKAIGRKTCSTALVRKSLKTAAATKVNSNKAKSGGTASTYGLISQYTRGSGSTTISKVMANTAGQTVEFTRVNGKTTNSMEEASTPGQMEESTKVNT